MVAKVTTGLASGMDIKAIIDAMISVERIPIVEKQSFKEQETIQYNAFSALDTQLTTLHSTTQKLDSYLNWRQKSATSSNSSILSASASHTAYSDAYEISVTQLARSDRYNSNSVANPSNLGNAGGETFTINGVEITLEANSSLSKMRDAINTASNSMASGKKVRASIIKDKLVIESQSTGTDAAMSISDTSGILASMGIMDPANHRGAQNLEATIDGVSATSQSNTNITNLIEGVTLNFASTGDTTLTVKNDTATIKSLIKEFVEAYNKTMEFTEQLSSVTLSKLENNQDTTEQKIESKGVLQGEFLLTEIKNKSRAKIMAVDSSLPAGFQKLLDIGIGTTGRENRLSIIDEKKLDAALQNNFSDVEKLFRNGVVDKFNDYVYDLIDPLEGHVQRRMLSSQDKVKKYEYDIARMEKDLAKQESSLYAHFSAMEQVTADLNSQLKYLLSNLGIKS